jgi:hypothetical protein
VSDVNTALGSPSARGDPAAGSAGRGILARRTAVFRIAPTATGGTIRSGSSGTGDAVWLWAAGLRRPVGASASGEAVASDAVAGRGDSGDFTPAPIRRPRKIRVGKTRVGKTRADKTRAG